jgi:hypothetical protein
MAVRVVHPIAFLHFASLTRYVPATSSYSAPLCLIPVGFVMDLLCLDLFLLLHAFGFRFAPLVLGLLLLLF